MNRAIHAAIFLVVAGLAVEDAAAREGKFVSAQLSYWLAGVDGTAQTEVNGVPGTEFDLDSTFGIDEEDQIPAADVWFNFGAHSIRLSYFASSYDSDSVLSSDLIFEDELFPAGTPVASGFDFSLGRLHYNYRFIDTAVVEFGILVGADVYSGDGEVASTFPSLQATTDFTAPLPVVGVNLALDLPAGLLIYLDATGMPLDFGSVDGSFLDLEARLTWYIFDGPFGLSAGYRGVALDLSVEDEGSGDIEQAGYYGGVSVRF